MAWLDGKINGGMALDDAKIEYPLFVSVSAHLELVRHRVDHPMLARVHRGVGISDAVFCS